MAQQGVEKVGLEKHDFGRTARMAFYGGGKTFSSHTLLGPYAAAGGGSENQTQQLLTFSPSHLRPRRDDLVQLPVPQGRDPQPPQRHHPRARRLRPAALRADEPVRLPVHHGRARGHRAQQEARGHLQPGPDQELDGVALGADGQLQARAARAQGARRERDQLG